MAISELQLLQRESSRIRSGGTVQSPTQLLQTNLQKNASAQNEQNQKDTSFWGGVGYTLEKLGLGVLRGLEGVTDFVVGGVADLFGGESGDEFAESLMKSDWVNYGHADEWYDAGETMSFVGDVASGIGNMLPAIAVNFIPGVGQAASAAISTATFATSAAGQATSDIVKETGELSGKEWLYGTASGALEAGIEALSGGIGGTAAGKGIAKAFGKSTLGKVVGNFIGEGVEEVASDIANPLLKRATGVDKNAGIDWKGLPRTFAVGGATGAVMGGGKRVIDAAKVGGFNNLNTIESAQELTERQADNNIRQIKGKSAIYTEQDIARTKENLSKRLRKMDDTTRAQFLKANSNIANQFNEDGTVKDFAPAPETYNEGTYSASLKGRESTLAYKPVAETSAESDVAKKVMKTLTKMTDGNTNIVLTDELLTTEDGQKANGLYKDGVIYLDAKASDYDKALTVGVHEVIHGLEGTKEYNDLASYIAETISKDPELAKKYSVEKYRAVYDKILEGEWTEATKDYQASTEIFADYLANKVVTNEKMLNNLVMRNSNVVVRFVNWVRNSIAKLGENADEKLMRKGLKKLEKALEKALEAGTGGISLERVEELSKSAEKRLKTQDGNVQSVKFGENKKADGKLATARASIQTIDGRAIVVIDTDQDIFNGKDKAEYPKIVRQYMLARFKNKVLPIGKNKAYVNRQGLEEYAYPADRRMDEKLKTAKMKAGTELNNLLATAEYVEHQEDDGRHEDAVRGWDKYKTQFIVDEQLFEGEISLKLTQRGDVFYDMSKIKNITPGTSRSKSPTSSQSDVVEGNPSTSIIRENSEKSTQNAKKVEKTSTSRKSIDVEYANAIKDGDTALAQKMVDQAAKEAGYDKKRFHETKEENIIHVFNLDLNTNASADYGTPFGVFTKKHNRSVGLGGKQMSLYVKADRTFSVKDRTEIAKRLPQEYSSFVDKINAIDEEYDVKYEKFSDDLLDSFAEWLDENDANDKMRNAWDIQKTLEEQFGDVLPQDIIEKERKFLKVSAEWNEKTNQAILNAKKWLTKWLRTNNYDSMELEFDNGAGNRVTDALIVLDQEQVKSAEPATYDDNGNLIPLSKRFNKKTADIRYALDAELDKKTTERVQTAVSDMTMVERWKKAWDAIQLGKADQWIKAQIAWTDEQAGIIQAGKNVGVVVHGEVQRARVAKASAINMLNDSQRDYSGKKRVGDSLKAIFKPIQSRGKKVAQDFNLYLLHQLNVDRMSAEETAIAKRKELLKKFPDLDNAVNGRYANDAEWQSAVKSVDGGKEYLSTFDAENKPVFEKDVDKAFSQEKVQQLEKQYPEFKATAEKVWKYNQNLLQYRVDAGLITQAQADQMTKMYPHYVPAFYEHNGGGTSGAFVGQKGVEVKTGIKSAKGSTGVSNIEDVQTSIARQTVAVIRAASINKIVEKLYDGAMKTKNFVDFEIVGKESMTDPDVNYDTDIPKENQVFFYKDGERITLDVSQYIDAGFRGLTAGAQFDDPITKLGEKGVNLFKKLVTAWNPLFAVTNAVRDAQEALFYTKYGKRFFANYGKALVTRKSDPRLKELWEQYKAMGGTGSGYFSRETGVYDNRSKLKKGREWLGDKMQIVNEWVEQAPRFAEFVASVEAGNSLEQALYDSAEVTTNFSRGGKMAKALNRHLIPFLNPSIQGWSKMWRGWVAPMDGKSATEIERLSKQSKDRRFLSNYGALMFKAILCGVSVGLFNDMLYRWIDDDEDYANLPLNIKENYYLIKVGKKFIKIPKGRVVALYGSVWTRLSEAMNGNEDALNAWDWAKSASEMVSPLESAFRSIIAPVRDVQTNTTWYGGQIENASMENLAPSERYDEGTSKIAIALGKAFNYSPKKIHYILDQYSGVIGDVILPLTNNKAEKDPVSARFVVDPVYNNDISTKYYDYKEELTYAKNSGDTNAKLMLKYINEVQDDLSKMYQQKRDIANDKSLSRKEKREQTEIIQGLINATLSSSVDMADEFEQLLINSGFEQAVAILGNNATYKKMDEKVQNSAYSKLTEYYYEACLARLNGAKLGTKYTLYGSINATDLVVYLTEIGNIESDKDKKGNTIQGSRKEKVQKYIQKLKITVQQKYILSYLAGYAPTDNGKIAISKYLKNNGYTQKEVNDLWN